MKRSLFSVIVFLLLAGNLQAVNFGFGLRGGLNFTSLPSTQHFQAGQYRYTSLSDNYTGYHFGVMSQWVFTGFYLQPELLFSRTGIEMRREGLSGPGQDDIFFSQRYDHLVLPVTMGAKLGPLRIGAGPVFSLLLNESSTFEAIQEFRQEMNTANVALQFGLGLDLASLILDFKYETALTRFGDSVVVDGQTISYSTRPRQFILSIGFLF